jgi:AraC-like DNA-binding protein
VIVVDLAYTATGADPAERLAAWQETVNRVFLRLAIAPLPAPGGRFSGSVISRDWGELRVWQVTGTPMSAVRDQRHIRLSGCDDYLLISVRQVHRLFAAEGLTFGSWVREQRLRRCRDDLADPRHCHHTVAEIAARWGFRSPAHFTRAFQSRYGITPADYRRRASSA